MGYRESLAFRNPPDDLSGAVLVSRKLGDPMGSALLWVDGQAHVLPYLDERPWTSKNASQSLYVFRETTKRVLWIGNYIENQRPFRFRSDDEQERFTLALVEFAGADAVTFEEPLT